MPSSPSSDVVFRIARAEDVAAILALLADDPLGRRREAPADAARYAAAFATIEADPNNDIIVGQSGGRIVACAQMTLIPGLSRQGATRVLIEAVRVDAALRGRGVGERLMRDLEARARARGARLAQLTSDAQRDDAHRFYVRLGYAPSHVGFKRDLGETA